MYYIYMLRCQDNSIYTGITTDVGRRMKEHFSKDEKCAKYTATHTAQKLECVWETQSRVNASRLEYHIKKSLTKVQKEKLIKNQGLLRDFLGNKIDVEEYSLFTKG